MSKMIVEIVHLSGLSYWCIRSTNGKRIATSHNNFRRMDTAVSSAQNVVENMKSAKLKITDLRC